MVLKVTWRNKVKTFMIFLLWVAKGLYLEALGPSMIDLILIYKTTYESVTKAASGRGAGGFLGALLGAYLVEKFESHLDLCLALFTTAAALCVGLVASVPTIGYVWVLYVLLGAASTVVNIAGMRTALQIWRERSAAIVQLIHMGFGVGALLGPLVCVRFLAVTENTLGLNGEQIGFKVIRESRAHQAFYIIGAFTLFVALPFYLFHFTETKHNSSSVNRIESSTLLNEKRQTRTLKNKSMLDYINPASYADGNFWLGSSVFLLMCVYFFNLVGGEKAFGSFVRTVAVSVMNMDKTEGSVLNSGFWVSLTVSRFLFSFVSRHFHIQTLIVSEAVMHLTAITCVYLYGLTNAQTFWWLTLLEGFFVAPLYPTGVAFVHTQIDMSGFCLMIVALMGSFGDFVYLWSVGWVYDVYGALGVIGLTNIAGYILLGAVLLYRFVAPRLVTNDN